MAKLSEGKKKGHAVSDAAFLGEFPDPSVRLDHHSPEKRTFELCTDESLGIIEKPLKILYSYPAIVIGMIYVFFRL